ncbi:hypothetical protein [Mycolicibacterium chubuense]|uniref:hypothetical protein n=1 Tax=Mycolicibacterium chubuense TaxID=1800 RepID=UPI0013019337|nr:hypothetical protein [Mycolicibacterium chubuense]
MRAVNGSWSRAAWEMAAVSALAGKGARKAMTAGSTTVQSPAWTSHAWRRSEVAASVNSWR